MEQISTSKICSNCEKPTKNLHKTKCKVCYDVEYRARNREQRRHSQLQHYYASRDRQLAARTARYEKNSTRDREYEKAYRLKNLDRIREVKKIYRERTSEKWTQYHKQRFQDNRANFSAKRSKYRASKLKRTPYWLSQDQLKIIDLLYALCPKGHHVDHIVPLQGKKVSGLHVPWNLQIIPAKQNLSKGNQYE